MAALVETLRGPPHTHTLRVTISPPPHHTHTHNPQHELGSAQSHDCSLLGVGHARQLYCPFFHLVPASERCRYKIQTMAEGLIEPIRSKEDNKRGCWEKTRHGRMIRVRMMRCNSSSSSWSRSPLPPPPPPPPAEAGVSFMRWQ